MAWLTNGVLTNPTANIVMADTGPAGQEGTRDGRVVLATTVAARFVMQHRNVANTANVAELHFPLSANSCYDLPLSVDLQAGQRVRIIMAANVTGLAQASILVQ